MINEISIWHFEVWERDVEATQKSPEKNLIRHWDIILPLPLLSLFWIWIIIEIYLDLFHIASALDFILVICTLVKNLNFFAHFYLLLLSVVLEYIEWICIQDRRKFFKHDLKLWNLIAAASALQNISATDGSGGQVLLTYSGSQTNMQSFQLSWISLYTRNIKKETTFISNKSKI